MIQRKDLVMNFGKRIGTIYLGDTDTISFTFDRKINGDVVENIETKCITARELFEYLMSKECEKNTCTIPKKLNCR